MISNQPGPRAWTTYFLNENKCSPDGLVCASINSEGGVSVNGAPFEMPGYDTFVGKSRVTAVCEQDARLGLLRRTMQGARPTFFGSDKAYGLRPAGWVVVNEDYYDRNHVCIE